MTARHRLVSARAFAFAALAVGLMPVGGWAQSAMDKGLATLRQTPNYGKSVFNAAQKSTSWINNRCDGAKAHLDSIVDLLKPAVIDAQGVPQSGAWMEHILVDGCGTHRRLNVLLRVKSPGTVDAVPTLPGSSRADPTLQRDGAVFAFAAAAAAAAAKTCQRIYIFDTDFIGVSDVKPTVPGKSGWSERWTIAQCDKRIPVTMRFTPDATGTAISARPDTATP